MVVQVKVTYQSSETLQGVPKKVHPRFGCEKLAVTRLISLNFFFLHGRIIQQIKFWVEKCTKRHLRLLSKPRYSNFKIKGAFLKVTKFKSERRQIPNLLKGTVTTFKRCFVNFFLSKNHYYCKAYFSIVNTKDHCY